MADTSLLKTKVENRVRTWLANKFSQSFHSVSLLLTRVKDQPARHEFDAVSEDKRIVCAIKTASWKTSGGKRGAGKIQGAYEELYFLDHVEAEKKYLVLTDSEFFENFKRDTRGKLSAFTKLLSCELPEDPKGQVGAIRAASRAELGF